MTAAKSGDSSKAESKDDGKTMQEQVAKNMFPGEVPHPFLLQQIDLFSQFSDVLQLDTIVAVERSHRRNQHFLDQITDTQMHDVVAYLWTLK